VACKEWNQLPSDGFHWSGNSYDNTNELSATSWRHVKFIEQFIPASSSFSSPPTTASRVALEVLPGAQPPENLSVQPRDGHRASQSRWLMMSDVCKHCTVAPCQQACPTGAIIHTEFSNVYIQADICNGCSYCIAACPFGVITRAELDGHAHKCTLCYDRQRDGLVPACAKACPTESIQFGPIAELRERARRRVEQLQKRGITDAYLYGETPTGNYSGLHSFYLLVDRPAVYGLPEDPFNPWLNMRGDYLRALGSALVGMALLLVIFRILGP
jgi:formate dehydrogenase iron-sulfur subunit